MIAEEKIVITSSHLLTNNTNPLPAFMVGRQTIFPGGSIIDNSLRPVGQGPAKSWSIIFTKPIRKVTCFAWKKYGGTQATARQAAEQYQLDMSNQLGQTITLHKSFLHEVDREIQQFTAGFFDGDGCMRLSLSISGKYSNYCTKVMFSQSGESQTTAPAILIYFQSIYGGNLNVRKREEELQYKPEWVLSLHNIDGEPVVRAVSTFGTMKKPQADLILTYLPELIPRKHVPTTLSKIYPQIDEQLSQMKELCNYQALDIDEARLTIPYLAGLFDAEGCIQFNDGQVSVTITQVSSPKLLSAIKNKLGFGTVIIHPDNCFWWAGGIHSANAFDFLHRIHPFCIVKKPQIEEVLEQEDNIRKTKHRRTEDEQECVEGMKREIKRMKKM